MKLLIWGFIYFLNCFYCTASSCTGNNYNLAVSQCILIINSTEILGETNFYAISLTNCRTYVNATFFFEQCVEAVCTDLTVVCTKILDFEKACLQAVDPPYMPLFSSLIDDCGNCYVNIEKLPCTVSQCFIMSPSINSYFFMDFDLKERNWHHNFCSYILTQDCEENGNQFRIAVEFSNSSYTQLIITKPGLNITLQSNGRVLVNNSINLNRSLGLNDGTSIVKVRGYGVVYLATPFGRISILLKDGDYGIIQIFTEVPTNKLCGICSGYSIFDSFAVSDQNICIGSPPYLINTHKSFVYTNTSEFNETVFGGIISSALNYGVFPMDYTINSVDLLPSNAINVNFTLKTIEPVPDNLLDLLDTTLAVPYIPCNFNKYTADQNRSCSYYDQNSPDFYFKDCIDAGFDTDIFLQACYRAHCPLTSSSILNGQCVFFNLVDICRPLLKNLNRSSTLQYPPCGLNQPPPPLPIYQPFVIGRVSFQTCSIDFSNPTQFLIAPFLGYSFVFSNPCEYHITNVSLISIDFSIQTRFSLLNIQLAIRIKSAQILRVTIFPNSSIFTTFNGANVDSYPYAYNNDIYLLTNGHFSLFNAQIDIQVNFPLINIKLLTALTYSNFGICGEQNLNSMALTGYQVAPPDRLFTDAELTCDGATPAPTSTSSTTTPETLIDGFSCLEQFLGISICFTIGITYFLIFGLFIIFIILLKKVRDYNKDYYSSEQK